MSENWFSENASTAPPNLASVEQQLEQFIHRIREQSDAETRIVIVTGGGTRVNLEQNTVRFIDNFSSGSRAAACIEHFLEQGYVVINLHRRGCVAPFARHLSKAIHGDFANTFIDLEFLAKGLRVVQEGATRRIELDANQDALVDAIQNSQRFQSKLISIPFLTLSDYLWLLRAATRACASFGSSALVFLAAAVSDFYVPQSEMAEHKIQSREGPLHLELQQVPKMLGCVRHLWSPSAFCVSFKLETEEKILLSKSRAAIEKYGMHLVVANELHTRNQKVTLVYPTTTMDLLASDDAELEQKIVRAIVQDHTSFIVQQKAAK